MIVVSKIIYSRLFSSWAANSKSDGWVLAAKKNPRDIKIVMHAAVNASDFPCHNPINQRLNSSANTAAFPPMSFKSCIYSIDTHGHARGTLLPD